MELTEFTEFLVKSLVRDPEMVAVKELDSEEDTIIIQVLVNQDDMGAVIGKEGRLANAIRTLVQASSYVNGNKKVKINIDSF